MAMEKLLVLIMDSVDTVKKRMTMMTGSGMPVLKAASRATLPTAARHRENRRSFQSAMRPVTRPVTAPLIMRPTPLMPKMRLKA